MSGFLAVATQRAVVMRSLRIAVVVGTILGLVNHGGALVSGHVTAAEWVQIAVSYVVPFFVATWSAAAQQVAAPRS